MGKDSLATRESYALTINDDVARQFAEMAAGGGAIDVTVLPTVKVPAGGGLNFELPSGDATKELRGVMILRQPVRAYWAGSIEDTGGGQPPDCSSQDAVTGHGDPGGDCLTCPLSQWGSKPDGGNAQACRHITRVFLLQPGHRLPLYFPAPPSAFRAAYVYNLALFDTNTDPFGVETVITLEKTQSKGGVGYSRPVFRRGEPLAAEESDAIRVYAARLVPALKGIPVAQADAA